MTDFSRVVPALTLVTALSACVTAGAKTGGSSEPGSWSGSFKQPQLAASAVVGPATPGRGAAYGSISLLPVTGQLGRFNVELSISAPVDGNTPLAWAIFSGPCGTPSPAVAPLTDFPTIETSGGGGRVQAVMALDVRPRGSYHVNVYWASRPSDVSNVMMCANLAENG